MPTILREETLSEGFLKAQQRRNGTLLKHVADTALFTLGFFPESVFYRSGYDGKYYISMGKLAYSTMSQWCRGFSLADLFEEVADNFLFIIEVLNAMSESYHCAVPIDDRDVLRLYDRWLHTKSSRAEYMLQCCGIAVTPGMIGKPN